MSATEVPVISNAAAAGCLGGMSSGRQPIVDASGALMQPSDFAEAVEAAGFFSAEEQVALGASYAGDGGTNSYFNGLGATNVTVVAATAAEANAHQTLPAAMMLLSMASFDNQPPPPVASLSDGYYAPQANAVSSVFVNAASTANLGTLFLAS